MHLHRRPPPGCSWLQNCAKSGPQAARNGRAPGGCAPGACAPGGGPPGCISGGGPPGCCISDGGAPGGCPSGDCAFAPGLASVRMAATAKAILIMRTSLLWSAVAYPRQRPTENPLKSAAPRRLHFLEGESFDCRRETHFEQHKRLPSWLSSVTHPPARSTCAATAGQRPTLAQDRPALTRAQVQSPLDRGKSMSGPSGLRPPRAIVRD